MKETMTMTKDDDDNALNCGTFDFLSAPPLRMTGFWIGGLRLFLQTSRQNLDPPDKFAKGAEKKRYPADFIEGRRQKFEGSDSSHP